MNAVIEAKPTDVSTTSNVIEIISRAASDPSVDVNKLERLMEMHTQLVARESEKAFNAALNACQAAVGRISADASNPQTQSRYATYAKLDKVLRPIYIGHGLSLSFDEGDSPTPEHVRILCHVSHSGGHTRTYHKDMPADGKGAKGGDVMTKTHARGAAQSYGMRYLLKGIFNIAIGEEDNDGNEVGELISEAQVADLKAVLTEVGADIPKFLKYIKANSLKDIPVVNYETVVKVARSKARK